VSVLEWRKSRAIYVDQEELRVRLIIFQIMTRIDTAYVDQNYGDEGEEDQG